MTRVVKIIAHCLVKNEERFVWYAINSVLPYVDLIMVWDTGSTVHTVPIIKSIVSSKIEFREVGGVDEHSFTDRRQQMLTKTGSDITWIMILDGDDIWPEMSIKTATNFARTHPEFESIVVRTHNLVGDIYHRSPEFSGHYNLAGRIGHFNLRFLNKKKIPGLHADKPHGQQGYYDNLHRLVQERNKRWIKFIDVYLSHATHLVRSETSQLDQTVVKRSGKFKHSLGLRIPPAQIPEVFFKLHPKLVPSVTRPASVGYWVISSLVSPLKIVKRILWPNKDGY